MITVGSRLVGTRFQRTQGPGKPADGRHRGTSREGGRAAAETENQLHLGHVFVNWQLLQKKSPILPNFGRLVLGSTEADSCE